MMRRMEVVVVEAVLAPVGHDRPIQRRVGGSARALAQRRRARPFAGIFGRLLLAALQLLGQLPQAGGVFPLQDQDLVFGVDHLLVGHLRLFKMS